MTEDVSHPLTAQVDLLHAAICQAVIICNSSLSIAESEDGRKVGGILKQALDDFCNMP